MKRCPKCNTGFDDSWKVCLHCRIELEEIDNTTPDMRVIDEVRSEISDIRSTVAKLNERLNFLEGRLKQGVVKEVPQKPQPIIPIEREKVAEKERISTQVISKTPKAKTDLKEKTAAWKRRSESFEQMLGGKWFNKLGILAVVVGVALLIGYSFKYMGPAGKIAIGYAVGMGLLIFGSRIEKKEGFSVYGKTLIGGGWALTYFTTFAMHHIPVVQLVKSPVVGMMLLLGISIAAVIHIYNYRSQMATGYIQVPNATIQQIFHKACTS